MIELSPLHSELWPTLFMTATVHVVGGSDTLWQDWGRKPTQSIFALQEGNANSPDIASTVERYDTDHARLRFFVVPPADDDDGSRRSRSARVGRRGSLAQPLSLDDVVNSTAKHVHLSGNRRYTFDCVATLFLNPTEYRTKVRLPVRLWDPSNGPFGDLVGARFSYTRRGVADSWIAVDLIEEKIRVQIHFTKKFPISTDCVGKAWHEVLAVAAQAIVAAEASERDEH